MDFGMSNILYTEPCVHALEGKMVGLAEENKSNTS